MSNRESAADAASLAETFFDLIRLASSPADSRQRSSIINSPSSVEVVAPLGRRRHTAASQPG
jgi:hypothetical protein